MSLTLFDIKRSIVDLSNCASSYVRIGNSHCVSETIDTCLHWQQTRGHCAKWRENGCGDESHQLRQYRYWRPTWNSYGLVHLSEVGRLELKIVFVKSRLNIVTGLPPEPNKLKRKNDLVYGNPRRVVRATVNSQMIRRTRPLQLLCYETTM
jgi:hypothetical protein